ncbi:hypothetical protein P692DRAFT_20880022 [Suillus brevipes Sb2]|nr:hypothetical protein P692DRAFT_20880022 [Suillus brevipes Sb2]
MHLVQYNDDAAVKTPLPALISMPVLVGAEAMALAPSRWSSRLAQKTGYSPPECVSTTCPCCPNDHNEVIQQSKDHDEVIQQSKDHDEVIPVTQVKGRSDRASEGCANISNGSKDHDEAIPATQVHPQTTHHSTDRNEVTPAGGGSTQQTTPRPHQRREVLPAETGRPETVAEFTKRMAPHFILRGCHIPYSGPYFPSLLSPSFPLCLLYFSRISPATSVHHPT